MAVSQTAYNIIKKAVIIKIKRGEDAVTAIASYPKLSAEQAEQMLIELQEEGIVE